MGGRLALVRRLLAAAVLAALVVPRPAEAADIQITTTRSTFTPGDDEFGVPTLYVPQGTGITITNTDVFAAHGMSSDVQTPTGERLFESGILNFRTTAPVSGVAALKPGSYPFHCPVHEDNMHGLLVVL